MIHNTINLLALKLPGQSEKLPTAPGLKGGEFGNLNSFLSGLLNIAFYLAAFLAFYYLIWGAFAYIMAQGKKEDLAKARARITWALIGLMVIFMAYLIGRFVGGVFSPGKGGLPF